MKFGVSSFVWVSPFSGETLDKIEHSKQIGFDIFEIAVEDPDLISVEKAAKKARESGIELQICGVYGETRDISSNNEEHRKGGIDYSKRVIDMAAGCGASEPYVAGPMYSAVGKARLLSAEEKAVQTKFAVENMKLIADYALEKGVRLAIEPLNRFETDFINTVEQGLEFLKRVNRENVGFLLDTFHMNIEEKSLPMAIRMAEGKLFDFHSCSNDRGTPGEDHIDWQGIKDAFNDIGYDGPCVIESFTIDVKEIAKAVSLWRPLAESQEALARDGLEFLRKTFR